MTLKDKTAIVTGGGKGIGAAIALKLAREGAAILVNYARDAAAAENVVQRIAEKGGQAVALKADVSAASGIEKMFDAAETAFGPVDILVNNAGIMRLGAISETSDADLDAHVAVNLAGAFRGMRAGSRRLRDGGRIINISSSVIGMRMPGYGLYAATKAAVEAMGQVLAKELGPRGITVNAVAPGPVATELFFNGKSEEMIQAITRSIPLGRLGAPEDIAETVAFIAGPGGGWINGQTIRANGGMI
ncbi:SDR family oxidoreductase [Nisaea sediminum]|uniref:SDR family oxidoreductase n=1 Tax=Nisaea sediminum TaxID=2775867 RepID=UPI001867C47D|nr:SDR family oxidoreductase [Nisaea sediminum]